MSKHGMDEGSSKKMPMKKMPDMPMENGKHMMSGHHEKNMPSKKEKKSK